MPQSTSSPSSSSAGLTSTWREGMNDDRKFHLNFIVGNCLHYRWCSVVKHWQIFMFKCKGVKMLFLLSKRTNQIARKKTTKKTQTNCEGATLRELQQRCTSRFVFGSETETKKKTKKHQAERCIKTKRLCVLVCNLSIWLVKCNVNKWP